jgi:cytochrome c biogenesis protein CcdA/thiol-disulfide isomerase/thioredoxin
MTLYVAMFAAGVLTILLPCILPLVPIVLGASVTGRSAWRPLLTVLGMLVSFVAFTFLLNTLLSRFVEAADLLRISTYYMLLLFGLGFLFHHRALLLTGAVIGALVFFQEKGWMVAGFMAILGCIAVIVGGPVAAWLQSAGTNAQTAARKEFGNDSGITTFILGLTMGLVWVPCAGPALGFALTLVRDEPGIRAFLALLAYGLGTAIPLLLIGYGGQAAVRSTRAVSRLSGRIKQVCGVLLILTAVGFHTRTFENIQLWLTENTALGTIGTDVEQRFFGTVFHPESSSAASSLRGSSVSSSSSSSSWSAASSLLSAATVSRAPIVLRSSTPMVSGFTTVDPVPSNYPVLSRAPELAGGGTWHNSSPLTMAGLKGKVVLVDFWTYSCINCIRTLPYLKGYWAKYKDAPFVLVGVHTPEFIFEKSEANVRDAIERHGLSYPVVQDNDFAIWKAFANRYWPAKYLIDAEGRIRYTHFGEGDYEETDEAIAALLKETGVEMRGEAVGAGSEETGRYRNVSAETYLSSRSWPAFGNGTAEPTEDIQTYVAPSTPLTLHKYYLDGAWQLVDDERQVLRGDTGSIRMKFLGGEINLVLGSETGKTVEADVVVDGKAVKTLQIKEHDLYNLFTGEYGEHVVTLTIKGAGVGAYAFTFGS